MPSFRSSLVSPLTRGLVGLGAFVPGAEAQDEPEYRHGRRHVAAGARGAAVAGDDPPRRHAPVAVGADRAAALQFLHQAAVPQEQVPARPSYVHIHSTDVRDRESFWYTERATVVGEDAEDEWDPVKLINTDRPDFTDVAAVVGKGVVQIESGLVQRRRDDEETRIVTESLPNVLLRVGTSDSFELRAKWRGAVRNEVTDLATGVMGSDTGASDLELGCKWVMAEQHDWWPMHTLVTRVNVPTGAHNVTADELEPGFSYIYNWQVRRWWFIRGNTGFDLFQQPQPFLRRDGGGAPTTTVDSRLDSYLEISQSISSYMQIAKRMGIFKEWFMFKRHGSRDDHSDHYHDYGLYLYLTPDLQLDGRIGWRIGDHLDESLYGLGISTRF
jgi:hypothetical protein